VLGAHGDSQVPAWSSATINGIPAYTVLPPDSFRHDELAQEFKKRAESIFYAKGATSFGIGSVVASICASILSDSGDVRPISHFQPDFGCCFSLPVILGRNGIVKTIKVPHEAGEDAAIAKSAETLRGALGRIKGR
jgi:L-lactate dehydrogenase